MERYVSDLCGDPDKALEVANGDEALRPEIVRTLVTERHLKTLPQMSKAAELIRRHRLLDDALRIELLDQGLSMPTPPAEQHFLARLLCDLAKCIEQLDRGRCRRVLAALDPEPHHLFRWLEDRNLAFAAAERALLLTTIGKEPELWWKAITLVIQRCEPSELQELTARCADPAGAKRAAAFVVLTFADAGRQSAHLPLVMEVRAFNREQLPRQFWVTAGSIEPYLALYSSAVKLVSSAGVEALTEYFTPAEEDGDLLLAAAPALRDQVAVAGRVVARYARRPDHDPRVVIRALEVLFAEVPHTDRFEERERRQHRELRAFHWSWFFRAFSSASDRDFDLTRAMGLDHQPGPDAPCALAPTDAGAIAASLEGALRREALEQGEANALLRSWWTACANTDERTLAFLDATRFQPYGLRPWLEGAPPEALLPILRGAAQPEFVDALGDRVDALRLCVKEGRLPELRGRARARLASLGEDAPPTPAQDLSEQLWTVAYLEGEGSAQNASVDVVLELAPEVVAAERGARSAMVQLVRRAPAERSVRAVAMVVAVVRAQPAGWWELNDVLAWEGWADHGDALDALATTLSSLDAGEARHVLERAPAHVKLRFARNTNAPATIRTHAIRAIFNEDAFDPGLIDVSRDPALVTDLLELAVQDREPRFLEYAVDRAAWAVVARPLRTADLEEQASPSMRLRELLIHIARNPHFAAHDVGARIRDQLWRELRRVHHEKKKLKPSAEVVRAWIEAAGRLRDERLIGRVQEIRTTLHSREKVLLSETIEQVLGEMHRPRLTDREAELRLVFRALRIGGEEVRS